ncbi:MAG: EAL domain-containing protein [Moraxellaceae bacterium]|nr:EAL domain-containing protein [Moraxellaceae bacterium]
MLARVLIVEDDPAIAGPLRMWLESNDYVVPAWVDKGEDVEEAVNQHRPDVILMDVMLGGRIDGITVAYRLSEAFGPPVIFMTGQFDEASLERAEAAQPYGFVAKPFRFLDVRIAIRLALARRRAEIEAETHRRRLELALDAVDLGVWEWNSAEQSLVADERSRELLALDRPVADASSADDEDVPTLDPSGLADAMREGRDLSGVYRVASDAQPRWVEVFARLPAVRRGTSIVTGAVRDITAQIEKEQALRTSRVVFDTAAEAIVMLSHDRKVVTANPAFLAMTGYSLDAIIGTPLETLVHARRGSDAFCPPLESFENDQWHGENACLRADGSVFIAWVHVALVRGMRGEVQHYVIAFSDTTALHEARQQLDYMAYHDALTGLGNRLSMERELDAFLSGERGDTRLGLLFMDLDDFKGINDTMGHSAGDQLLVAIARRIQGVLRARDRAIRLGGDEFVVMVSAPAGMADCQALAEKLLNVISQPVRIGDTEVCPRASAGIAIAPEHGVTRDALIRAADMAMYEAKQRDAGGYAFFSADMREELHQRKLVEEGIRHCMEDGMIGVLFQPIVSLYDGRVSGWEALARLTLDNLGEVPPERFIPIAEQSGLMDQMGRCVMHKAIREFASWQKVRKKSHRLALNLSASQVASTSFAQELLSVLDDHDLDAARVDLEVSEGLLYSTDLAGTALARLRNEGFSIVLDDFGSGMSSLAMLKHLPIDRIKIGRAFVSGLGKENASDVEIVRALTSLAGALGLRMAATGIETEVQRRQLLRLGCNEAQGHYFSPAVSLADLDAVGTLAEGIRN